MEVVHPPIEELSELLRMLRKRGVRVFKTASMEVEFSNGPDEEDYVASVQEPPDPEEELFGGKPPFYPARRRQE